MTGVKEKVNSLITGNDCFKEVIANNFEILNFEIPLKNHNNLAPNE